MIKRSGDMHDSFLFRMLPGIVTAIFVVVIAVMVSIFAITIFSGMALWDLGPQGIAEYLGTLVGNFNEGMNK